MSGELFLFDPEESAAGVGENRVLNAVSARELTRRIREGLEHSYSLIIAAWKGRVWLSLAYEDWDDYVQREFGSLALEPPKEDRQAVVASLREAGMSFTAIEDVTGVPRATAWRDVKEAGEKVPTVPFGTVGDDDPTPITGVNGKSYKASVPATRPKQEASGPLFEDMPLSDELLALSPSEMGIGVLTPSPLTSGPTAERRAAAKRLTGSAASPLPMVIRLAGEITLDPGVLTVDEDSDAETLSGLAADASRGVLALSHVLTSIDATVFSGEAGDSMALGAVVTDAVDELGRFLDALHSRKRVA